MNPADQVVVCVPTSSGPAVAPCTVDANGTAYLPSIIVGHVLTDAEYSSLQLASAPVDWVAEQYYFEYGFAAPLLALVIGIAMGGIVKMFRDSAA